MNKLEVFGMHDNGQEILKGKCLHRYSVSAGEKTPEIEIPICELEESLIMRLPAEKKASRSGLENYFFSETFLRVSRRVSIDGIFTEVSTEDVPISKVDAAIWSIAHLGKAVCWENLNVEMKTERFTLDRKESYETNDCNVAAVSRAISFAEAEDWAKKYCGQTAGSLVCWLKCKMAGLPAGETFQLC